MQNRRMQNRDGRRHRLLEEIRQRVMARRIPEGREPPDEWARQERERIQIYVTFWRLGIGIILIGSLIALLITLFLRNWIGAGISGVILGAIGIYLSQGFYKVPTKEEWLIEVLGVYYITSGRGVHFLFPGLMKIAAEVSLKDLTFPLFQAGEEVELKDSRVKVVADAVIQVVNSFRVHYQVEGGVEAFRRLVTGTLQDAVQTRLKEENIESVISLRGTDIGGLLRVEREEEIEKKDPTYQLFIRNIWDWGARVKTLILRDFDLPETARRAREKVFEIDRERTIQRIRREVERFHGQAEAERLNILAWNIAASLAGIEAKAKYTEKERREIARYLPEAWSNLLEQHSIEAVKPTDKIIVTEGRGIGRTVGRDVAREEIRRTISESRRGEQRRE